MDILKSSRFWISISIIISITVLAALGKIIGDVAISSILGLLAGFGVAKAKKSTTGEHANSPTSSTPAIFPLLVFSLLASCASVSTQITRTRDSINALSMATIPIYHKICTEKAIECATKKISVENCIQWQSCDQSRSLFVKIIDSALVSCGVAYSYTKINKDNDAKQMLSEAVNLVYRANEDVKQAGILGDKK